MPVNELHVCSQNREGLRSELLAVGMEERSDFHESPFSFLPLGIEDLDFIPCVMRPPQQILQRELVEIEPSFLFTLHFLCIKTFLPCLGNEHGGSRVVQPPGVSFCSGRHYLF